MKNKPMTVSVEELKFLQELQCALHDVKVFGNHYDMKHYVDALRKLEAFNDTYFPIEYSPEASG